MILSLNSTLPDKEEDTPEKNLIAAIVFRAFYDAVKPGTKPQSRTRQDARDWIRSDSVLPFSFIWCLQTLAEGYHVSETAERIRDIVDGKNSWNKKLLRRSVRGKFF